MTRLSDRLIHPRRSNKAKMLGQIEDAARTVARSGIYRRDDEIVPAVDDFLGWDVSGNEDEADLAVRAYHAERSKLLAG